MKKQNIIFLATVILTFITNFNLLNGQDRQFARTYQTMTLPKGVKDLEIWSTFRTGRDYFYNRLDERVEYEIGLTDRLQTAFYLNATHKASGIPGDTTGTIFSKSQFSVSSEWKYKITDPVTKPVGFALYGEFGLSPSEFELEGKLLFDKIINKNIFALNIVGELEYENEIEVKPNKETETKLELEEKELIFNLAYLYNFKPNFGLGIESLNHNEFTEKEGWEHSSLFAGPTLFVSGDKYFIIFNFLSQLYNFKKHEHSTGNIDLIEHEKYEARLLLGFTL